MSLSTIPVHEGAGVDWVNWSPQSSLVMSTTRWARGRRENEGSSHSTVDAGPHLVTSMGVGCYDRSLP
jgi:hypothetical protein